MKVNEKKKFFFDVCRFSRRMHVQFETLISHLLAMSLSCLLLLNVNKTKAKVIQTRNHSSRMRTARFSSSGGRGVCPTTSPPEADLPPLDSDFPWMLVMWPVMHAGKPPPVDRQTPVKTLPCHKLRLRAVMIMVLYAHRGMCLWRLLLCRGLWRHRRTASRTLSRTSGRDGRAGCRTPHTRTLPLPSAASTCRWTVYITQNIYIIHN